MFIMTKIYRPMCEVLVKVELDTKVIYYDAVFVLC